MDDGVGVGTRVEDGADVGSAVSVGEPHDASATSNNTANATPRNSLVNIPIRNILPEATAPEYLPPTPVG